MTCRPAGKQLEPAGDDLRKLKKLFTIKVYSIMLNRTVKIDLQSALVIFRGFLWAYSEQNKRMSRKNCVYAFYRDNKLSAKHNGRVAR